jgi:hypothetical protein
MLYALYLAFRNEPWIAGLTVVALGWNALAVYGLIVVLG